MTESMTQSDVQKTIKALKSNRFDPVEYAATAEEAAKIVFGMIPPDAKVGMGGSTSLMQLGVVEELVKKGQMTLQKPDIYLTSSNAITENGKLVNTDMTGNRVSAMIFGPKQVIVVAGINKIVKDLDAAFDRIKGITAPAMAKIGGLKTPCAVEGGKCNDCNSSMRVCAVTTIIESKPRVTQISVVLVGEDIGLGWEADWPDDRKKEINAVFRKNIARLRETIQSIR
ncbi:MAG: lactate utilization protein [Deltaproteobacteria bacterium]|nr:lactate utilization protein [Deltaproteobacteria bacterium]